MPNKFKFFSFGYAVVLFSLLLAPIVLAVHAMGGLSVSRFLLLTLDSFAWLIATWGLLRFIPRTLALFILLPALSCIILLRVTYLGLIIFSGAGFTSDFFIHLEWQSIVLAWQEYFLITAGGLLTSIVFLGAGFLVGRRVVSPPALLALVLVVVGGVTIGFRHSHTPEGEFLLALWRWHQPIQIGLRPQEVNAWREYPLVNVGLISKHDLLASTPVKPLNIILIYLESVGRPLLDHPEWPDLLPGLKSLAEQNSFVENFFASGYVTIEGLVNSQCGTLFPFDRGDNSLAGNDGLADEMVCLADVLAKAGYQSSYLGGANMSYAGKGDFLQTHGFQTVKGGEHWASLGIHQRPGTWGVSDADLFEQARKELELLRADGRPFNLTLLTIGTHLPGYSYQECTHYQDGSERFLNALHCTDQLLNRWLKQIEVDGYLEDSIVVITADHHIFPSPEMRRLFGADVAERRRLPFIVLDPHHRKSLVSNGASYDLAPTLLDLAGVDHNNFFSLGRSLLRPESKRDYFFKRYADVLPGVEDRHSHGECDADGWTDQKLGVPLTPCQRQSMKVLLGDQIRSLSKQVTRLECDKPALTQVHLPHSNGEPMKLLISGKDQSDRFVLSPGRVSPDSLGLYLARIEDNFEIRERVFIPEAILQSMENPPDVLGQDIGWLLIWHGTSAADLPSWLDLIRAQMRGANAAFWLVRVVGDQLEWLPGKSIVEGAEQQFWIMDKNTCDSLSGGGLD